MPRQLGTSALGYSRDREGAVRSALNHKMRVLCGKGETRRRPARVSPVVIGSEPGDGSVGELVGRAADALTRARFAGAAVQFAVHPSKLQIPVNVYGKRDGVSPVVTDAVHPDDPRVVL
jgi:hypothetical protein